MISVLHDVDIYLVALLYIKQAQEVEMEVAIARQGPCKHIYR